MILTVTPNPMLDKTIWLSKLQTGGVHRAARMQVVAGGKGLNVSRALMALGEETLATGFLGGHVGREIRRLLSQEKIPHAFVEIASTTREGFTFVETETGQRVAVFEPGHKLQAHEVNKLLQRIHGLLPQCRALALCGSMPCDGYDSFYAEVITLARETSVPVFLDSYHQPLKQGLRAGPQFVKPNRDEALATFGIDSRRPDGMMVMLRLLAKYGTEYALITDAGRPVGAMFGDRPYLATPPQVQCVDALGSGDAMVAAMLYGWLRGMAGESLIRFAVAAGSVNARHPMPGYADLEEINSLAGAVRMESMGNSQRNQ